MLKKKKKIIMAKKIIRLTESDVMNMVKEILKEISRDTLASANFKALDYADKASYTGDDYKADKYREQANKFNKAWADRYMAAGDKENPKNKTVSQKKMSNDARNILKGKRVYGRNPKGTLDKNTWYDVDD
jgi:hypothetical protein